MEIPEKGHLQSVSARERLGEELPKASAAVENGLQKGTDKDTVELTASGRVLKTAVDQVQLLPEIRTDRVLQLKRQLAEGTYRVQGDRIAVDMMDETLENNSVLRHIDTKV